MLALAPLLVVMSAFPSAVSRTTESAAYAAFLASFVVATT